MTVSNYYLIFRSRIPLYLLSLDEIHGLSGLRHEGGEGEERVALVDLRQRRQGGAHRRLRRRDRVLRLHDHGGLGLGRNWGLV